MAVHNNVHIPSESWPGWTWHALEFGIVLAASMVVAWKASDLLLPHLAAALGHAGALESWAGVTVHSPAFRALDGAVEARIAAASNWAFYGIVGAVFGAWYMAARGLVLGKRALR